MTTTNRVGAGGAVWVDAGHASVGSGMCQKKPCVKAAKPVVVSKAGAPRAWIPCSPPVCGGTGFKNMACKQMQIHGVVLHQRNTILLYQAHIG